MLHDINVGYFINLVLYSIPLIGRVIYLDCMKYHFVSQGEGGGLEGVNFVSRDK